MNTLKVQLAVQKKCKFCFKFCNDWIKNAFYGHSSITNGSKTINLPYSYKRIWEIAIACSIKYQNILP